MNRPETPAERTARILRDEPRRWLAARRGHNRRPTPRAKTTRGWLDRHDAPAR